MLKSFIGPLVLTLAIALFVLLMQFVWIYIDDLVGKGLAWYIIAKLMLLVSFTLIPMALPLAILLSSIMTFGNLAENHELACMKAAGLSLPKIMSPLIVLIFFISVGAFFFANNVLPWVNLKKDSLLYDIRMTKPALNIHQDIFYNGIDGYSIRIAKKDPDQETIHNIMIYDHTTPNAGNIKVILAKSGKMKMSTDQRYLVLTMDNGNAYQEMLDNNREPISHPMLINHFAQQTIYFDLSDFRFSRTNEELFKSNYEMLDLKQLRASADSLSELLVKNRNQFYADLNRTYFDTLRIKRSSLKPLSNNIPEQGKISVLETAINSVRNAKQFVQETGNQQNNTVEEIIKRQVEWQKKFTFACACFILFFIGAPFGAIIKKGGLGMPVVVSALFFILFYIISIISEKSAKEEVLSVIVGMWLPTAVFLPIGAFFTYKASMDSTLFERDIYINILNRIKRLGKKASS